MNRSYLPPEVKLEKTSNRKLHKLKTMVMVIDGLLFSPITGLAYATVATMMAILRKLPG